MNNKHSVYEILDLTTEEKNWFQVQEKASHLIIDIMDRRYELKMSQRELAKKSGIKQPMIARIEKFDATPRIDTLIKLCDALGLKIVIEKNDKNVELINEPNSIIYNGKEYQQNSSSLNEDVKKLDSPYNIIDESKITKEELGHLLEEALNSVKEGRTYTADEAIERLEEKIKQLKKELSKD